MGTSTAGGVTMLVTLFVSLWTLIEGEGKGGFFPAGASMSLLLLETEMNQRLGTKYVSILRNPGETTKQ